MTENIEEQVLALFRNEISILIDHAWKEVALELDTLLQDYAEGDELLDAVEGFGETFGVDVSVLHWRYYFPWENLPLLTRWFKASRQELQEARKPLTVRMFSESAKSGRWLYD
jgi:hypothetical protein